MKKYAAIFATILIAACASTQGENVTHYLHKKKLGEQTPQAFQHCHGYGCQYIADVTLTKKEWKAITKAYGRPKNPEKERESIKRAVAAFEQIVGEKTGTSEDHWGTFRKTGHYQQDCVDESTNTTIYLSLLEQKELLKFHVVGPPSARFPIIHAGRWPHQTAVISQKDTNEFYVVDSWFHDNGSPPEILPLKQWKEGWKPDRSDDAPE